MNKSEIQDLISLKQEGAYWDFKREWYSQNKKDDLLHDIICMSNNLSNRDAYIIIGVDEENDYSFSSIEFDQNRKNRILRVREGVWLWFFRCSKLPRYNIQLYRLRTNLGFYL